MKLENHLVMLFRTMRVLDKKWVKSSNANMPNGHSCTLATHTHSCTLNCNKLMSGISIQSF